MTTKILPFPMRPIATRALIGDEFNEALTEYALRENAVLVEQNAELLEQTSKLLLQNAKQAKEILALRDELKERR